MELDEEVAENIDGFQEAERPMRPRSRAGAETAADKTHFHADGAFLIVQCPVLW
jgi:hypothetical protein